MDFTYDVFCKWWREPCRRHRAQVVTNPLFCLLGNCYIAYIFSLILFISLFSLIFFSLDYQYYYLFASFLFSLLEIGHNFLFRLFCPFVEFCLLGNCYIAYIFSLILFISLFSLIFFSLDYQYYYLFASFLFSLLEIGHNFPFRLFCPFVEFCLLGNCYIAYIFSLILFISLFSLIFFSLDYQYYYLFASFLFSLLEIGHNFLFRLFCPFVEFCLLGNCYIA